MSGVIYGALLGKCHKAPNSYRSSIDTIALNCLVFEKIAFFLHSGDKQTNRQTDEQMYSTDAQAALAVASGSVINGNNRIVYHLVNLT